MPRSFIFFNLGAILIEPLFRLTFEENEDEPTSQSPAVVGEGRVSPPATAAVAVPARAKRSMNPGMTLAMARAAHIHDSSKRATHRRGERQNSPLAGGLTRPSPTKPLPRVAAWHSAGIAAPASRRYRLAGPTFRSAGRSCLSRLGRLTTGTARRLRWRW
jgi:hypothetical protein